MIFYFIFHLDKIFRYLNGIQAAPYVMFASQPECFRLFVCQVPCTRIYVYIVLAAVSV